MISTPRGWLPYWLAILFTLTGVQSYSQKDSLKINTFGYLEDLIQAYLETREDGIDLDVESIMDRLEILRKNPIRLNNEGQPDLDDFILLTQVQIQALRNYIEQYGSLISIYELQVIPGFDLATIRLISPFIQLEAGLETSSLSLKEKFIKSQNQVLMRLSKTLEPQKGYQPTTSNSYTGDPYKYYLRFLKHYGNQLSMGLQGEKDAGEEFLKGANKSGFDSYSFHLAFRQLNKTIDDLIIGDYTLALGQGLVLQSGFGVGKNALATSIQRGGRTMRPNTSSNESNFFRGICTQFRFWKNLQWILFFSNRKKDGNESDDLNYFSGFLESGFHRTPSEIKDEKNIRETLFGQALKFRWSSGFVSWNTLSSRFDHYYLKTNQLYNQFAFRGNHLFANSLDHQYKLKNMMFFGEWALSNRAVAMMEGLQWSLEKYLDIAILYRNLDKKYPALYSGSFSENSISNNEKGLYLGSEYKYGNHWKFALYMDFWEHPWLTFNVRQPSRGYEHFFRVTYFKKRKLEAYIQYKNKVKQEQASSRVEQNGVQNPSKSSCRIQLNYLWGSGWESRSRCEGNFQTNNQATRIQGFLVYQDILYNPIQSKLSFSARLAYFNTDGYDNRIYAYENDLLNNYSLPAFSEQGFRYYLNLRWEANRNILLEGRWAQTRMYNAESIGSGLDEIQGNRRSDLKLQLRWIF